MARILGVTRSKVYAILKNTKYKDQNLFHCISLVNVRQSASSGTGAVIHIFCLLTG
jgi:hypothetical protein